MTGSASSPRALRVLWITTTAGPDGPGRALSGILTHWSREDTVRVCALRDVTPAFRDAVPSRVETTAIGMSSAFDMRALRRLDRLVADWRPDIIHTQLSRGDWVGRWIGRRRRVPVVSTIQNVHSRMYAAEFSPAFAWIGRTLDRVTSPAVSRFVAVSHGVRADLERAGIDSARIVVVPNTFDRARVADPAARASVRALWGAAADDVVVGTVALLKPQKGIQTLVDAARMAIDHNPRLRFVHIGDGPLADAARQWVDAAGLGARFHLLGRVAEPMTLLPGLDIFALPSAWEGLPIALLEAMAAGLPAVGTRVSGIEDVIEDGVTGRLVPSADAVGLAAAIEDLAGSADRRRALGAAGRAQLERYDARLVAEAYRAVYLEVAGLGRPTSCA